MRAQLGVAVGDKARLNVCELGVAVGLPRRTVKECLLDGVDLEDAAQLEALVALFMEKTQDEDRLLSRVAEVGIQSRSTIKGSYFNNGRRLKVNKKKQTFKFHLFKI